MKINSQKIKEAREQLNLSQGQLASLLGVSKVAVCWYENGDRTPSLEHFFKLADILHLSLNELSGREIDVVAEEDTNYQVKLPKKDLAILSELKKYKKLYKSLYNDPERTIKLIDKRMK